MCPWQDRAWQVGILVRPGIQAGGVLPVSLVLMDLLGVKLSFGVGGGLEHFLCPRLSDISAPTFLIIAEPEQNGVCYRCHI